MGVVNKQMPVSLPSFHRERGPNLHKWWDFSSWATCVSAGTMKRSSTEKLSWALANHKQQVNSGSYIFILFWLGWQEERWQNPSSKNYSHNSARPPRWCYFHLFTKVLFFFWSLCIIMMLILETWPRKSILNKLKTVFNNIFPIVIIKGKEPAQKKNINLFTPEKKKITLPSA